MLSKNEFITMSLDLNLFYLRIMKEHSLFLQLAFAPKDMKMASAAKQFLIDFEKLLSEATELAYGNVSYKAIASKQFVTQYTMEAERLTNFYTGAPFNFNLTSKELMLVPSNERVPEIEHRVDSLNRRAYRLTSALVNFKSRLLHDVLSCETFTFNYPLLIEHILREAKFYMKMLDDLNQRRDIMGPDDMIQQEAFWNRQMAEHAKFIAGLLDPTEETLINTARMFGQEFDQLTVEAQQATRNTFDNTNPTVNSISAMERLRDFKTAGTEGLLACKIKSIIIPLLADHVLREANHYLCILGVCNTPNYV